jgi:hypothetical protein
MRRSLLVFVGAALLAPPTASADIDIDLISRKTATPGQLVRVTAAGFVGSTPWVAPVVMRPAAGASRVSQSLYYGRLLRPPYRLVGTIREWHGRTRNRHAWGYVVFRVPRVKLGRYVFGLFCPPCARGPKGSLIVEPALVLTIAP